MAFKNFPNFIRRYYSYEIPERYRNSFYLANAALFDQVNWYVHRAYEVCYPRLVTWLRDQEPKLSESEASKRISTVIELLDQCNSIIDVRFPLLRENGSREIIRGFRSQYGLLSGFNTCLGGLRMKDDTTRDHMKALSALSNYKHACMGIRLAGAYGAIKIDPSQYTDLELQRIVKRFAHELYMKGFCDGRTDIIEPDINVGTREMAWIASIFPECIEKTMVSGKPVDMGGIENYEKMASEGIFFALDHFMNHESVLETINISKAGLNQKTFIIQGLGRLGSALAKFLVSNGAICVGIKDYNSYLYDEEGIDIEAALEHRKEHGSIEHFSKALPFANDDIFKESCDILILAAQQKGLICYMADKVKAKVVVEAANGAITPTAHRILLSRNKLVLPDIYVSSGHSVASYLEYLFALRREGTNFSVLRNLYRHILDTFQDSSKSCQIVSSTTTQKIVSCQMSPDVLTYAIDHVMKETGNELLEISKEYKLNLDLRTAGYIKAVESIHKSIYDHRRY